MPDPAVQEEISTIPASRRGLTGVTPANTEPATEARRNARLCMVLLLAVVRPCLPARVSAP